jgi:hypothetical protein
MAIVTRNDVDPALTGYLSLLAGQEERRRYEEAQAMRDAQLAEQQRQFDSRQSLDEMQFGAGVDQQLWNRGFQNRQLDEQTRARQAQLQAELTDREMRSQDRLQQIALQGDQQRAMYGDQISARLAEEQMQQQGVHSRQMQRLAADIGEKRLAQVLKQRDADLHAIRSAELSDEQYEDAMSQFEERYSRLGVPDPVNLPSLSDQYPGDQFNPEVILDQRNQEYPDVPWQIHPDGSVGPPKNWKMEYDPKFREQKQQQEQAEADDKRKQREADLAIKADEQRQRQLMRQEEARFEKRIRMHERRMPDQKRFTKKEKSGEGDTATMIDVQDTEKFDAAMAKWEQEHEAIINQFNLGGGDQPIAVSSPDEIKAKVPIGGKYSVNGHVFTRTK